MDSGKVLLGLLAGVAVGALLGILFAPDKGSETRKKISAKSDEYATELKVKFDEFLAGLSEKFEQAKDEISNNIEHDKAKPEETKKEVKTTTV